jgi:hypothetical protein
MLTAVMFIVMSIHDNPCILWAKGQCETFCIRTELHIAEQERADVVCPYGFIAMLKKGGAWCMEPGETQIHYHNNAPLEGPR